MPTVGEILREAREKRNLTFAQVADSTKIRSDHLRALEAGNYDIFTAPVYIRGFTRSYGTLLRLDLVQLMALLNEELAATDRFHEAPRFTRKSRGSLDFAMLQLSKLNWSIVLPFVVLGLLLLGAVIGYRSWRNYQAKDPLRDLSPGLYQPKPAAGEVLPLPTNAVRR